MIAQTGASEKVLVQLGDQDFEKIYLYANSHAGYYPVRKMLAIKILFRNPTGVSSGAGTGRGRRCQADRFLCHGDPDGLHHL